MDVDQKSGQIMEISVGADIEQAQRELVKAREQMRLSMERIKK